MFYIFVEGDDDDRLIGTLFKHFNKHPTIIEYSCKSKNIVDNYFKSLKKENYLILTDLDNKKTGRDVVNHLKKKFPHVSEDRVIIVKKEIESWYIAGVSEKDRIKFKYGKIPNSTEKLSKEEVYSIIRNEKDRNILTELIRIANNFDIESATSRNTSFKIFLSIIQNCKIEDVC